MVGACADMVSATVSGLNPLETLKLPLDLVRHRSTVTEPT